jgi:hypothetical protein
VADNNIRVGFLTHVSRADVAAFMIGIIDRQTTYRKALTLSYPPKFGDSLRWLTSYLRIN